MKISKTVHQLKIDFNISLQISRYVYVYLIEGNDGYYLIDTGVKGCDKKIGEYIHKNGRSRQTINTVLLTHSHPDHIGGAKALKHIYGCQICSCAGEKNWVEDIDLQYRERPIPNFYGLVEGSVHVDRTLIPGEIIELEPGISLEVIKASGHSLESLCFYYREEKLLFVGDGIPGPEDVPIYVDSQASLDTLERLRVWKEVDLYCPAWDQMYNHEQGVEVIEKAKRVMEQLRDAAVESLRWCSRPDDVVSYVVPCLCQRLGMEQWSEHPLFKRSVLEDIQRMKQAR